MKKKIIIISGILLALIIIFYSLFYYVFDIERRFRGDNLRSWTGGQNACGIIWNKEPEAHRRLLNHPNLQVRFATGCIILNRSSCFRAVQKRELLMPRYGYTQEDIDNKEFTLKLIDFVQKKLDDKQKGD